MGETILIGLVSIASSIVLCLLVLFHVHARFLRIFQQISDFQGQLTAAKNETESATRNVKLYTQQIDELSKRMNDVKQYAEQCNTEIDMMADTIKRLQSRAAADKRHSKKEDEAALAEQLQLPIGDNSNIAPITGNRRLFGVIP